MGPTAMEPIHSAPARGSVRLELLGAQAQGSRILDGAWWPHSRDLQVELPELVAELRRQGDEVSRVSYHPDTWQPAPTAVAVDGGTVKIGWFRSMDPHLVTLTGVYGAGRLDLLVIPPDSLAAPAAWLMAAANGAGNRRTASAVLLAEPAANPGRSSVPVQRTGPFGSSNRDLSPA